MVWQKFLGRIGKGGNRSSRKHRQRRLRMERMERRELLASDLGAIAGVAFVDEAGDGSSVGDPPVLVDGGGNLVAPGTPGAQGIQIQLFEDTNGDTLFDVNDLLIGTDITDSNGYYRFDRLIAGRYFIQQQAVPQLNTPATIPVDVVVVNGIQTALIDDYSLTTQTVTADAGTPTNTDSALAPETIGGARDIQVSNTNAIGQVTVFVDSNADTLSIGSLGLAEGTALIQYDGNDNSLSLDASGLNGISLAGGAPGSTLDPGAGLIVETRADQAGETLFITVHTDASNSSTVSVPVPQNLTTTVETFVLFSSFTTATGSGADFNNVGAIEASLALSADTDVVVSIAEARRPDVVQADLANILPISLGGQVFLDNDPGGGQNNGVREGTEPGVVGITVDLYQLAGPTDVVDPTTQLPLTSTTSGSGGTYNFPGLDPGHYAVVVPSTAFGSGAILFGFANSTGNDPASDPDDNVDSDDNGTTLASNDVISGTITLQSNSEPTNDDDTDPNTNTTVDFGFFPQIDLSITKSLNAAASNIIADGNVVFDIVVQNLGPLDATNVVVNDDFPAGLTFTAIQNASGAFTTFVNGTMVEVDLGDIPAGMTATFQMTANIGINQTTDITNTATVSGTEEDIGPLNNSDNEFLDLISTDLRIEKTDLTDPVNAGTQLTYQISVTNDGPDDAAGVVVVDPLPPGVTFVTGDVDGVTNLVTLNAGTGEVTATVGPLTNTTASIITIVVDVPDDATTSPLNNSATVTASPNTDPDPSNNSTSEDTTVQREVDVEVTKTVSGTPIAGTDVTYTVTVINNGPSQARNVSVTDTLDSDLTLVPGSFDSGMSGVTHNQNGQDLSFDVGTLGALATATFTFDVSIASSATGTISNTATASTSDPDSDSTNDSGRVDMAVEQHVDLILQKDVDLTTAVPGQDQLVFNFTISHDTDSLSDATNVVMTDVLPAGLIGAVISAPNASNTDFSNGTVTVEFASIPVGQTETFTVTVDVDEAATGTVINPASVTADGTEIDDTNNSDDASTMMTPDFDVVVSKSVDDTTPGPNDTIIYTVTLTNEGPSTATGVVLSDIIPADLTFVSGMLDGQVATSDGTTVTFPAITLGAGSSEDATLTFTVDAAANGAITNTASVPDLSSDGENDTSNNSASADITVIPEVDLEISKSVSLTDAQVGSELTYTITVTNDGPSQATNVQVADNLPAGVTFVSGTGPNGESLSVVGDVVTVNGGTLDDQGSFSFTIIGTIATGASGNLINSATVSSDTLEIDTPDNTATATTAVDPMNSTIAGVVYLDLNNDGVQDASERGIAGVTLTLTGSDSLGNAVSETVTTDSDGQYQFSNLAQGTYTVTETQPLDFRDGMETAGTGAPAVVADDVFSEIGLGSNTDAIDFNFGERNERLSKRRFLASFLGRLAASRR